MPRALSRSARGHLGAPPVACEGGRGQVGTSKRFQSRSKEQCQAFTLEQDEQGRGPSSGSSVGSL